MACDDLITNQDLENAKKDATTMSDFVESDSPEIQSKSGKNIRTLQGINDAADNLISLLGGTDIGDYEDDLTLNSYNEYVVFDRAGATTGPSLWKAIPPRTPTPGTPLPYTIDSATHPDPTSDSNIEPFSDVNKAGAEQIAQEEANAGDSQLAGGNIWPLSSQDFLSLGAQSTVVSIDADRFRVDTGGTFPELLYLWEPSGTLPAAPFTIEDIHGNNFNGYDITINSTTLEFITYEVFSRRINGDITAFGVIPNDILSASANYDGWLKSINDGYPINIGSDFFVEVKGGVVSNSVELSSNNSSTITFTNGGDLFLFNDGLSFKSDGVNYIVGSGLIVNLVDYTSPDGKLGNVTITGFEIDGSITVQPSSNLSLDPTVDDFGFDKVEVLNGTIKNMAWDFLRLISTPYKSVTVKNVSSKNQAGMIANCSVNNGHPFYDKMQEAMDVLTIEHVKVVNERGHIAEAPGLFYSGIALWEGNNIFFSNTYMDGVVTNSNINIYDVYLSGIHSEVHNCVEVDCWSFGGVTNTGLKLKKVKNCSSSNKRKWFRDDFFDYWFNNFNFDLSLSAGMPITIDYTDSSYGGRYEMDNLSIVIPRCDVDGRQKSVQRMSYVSLTNSYISIESGEEPYLLAVAWRPEMGNVDKSIIVKGNTLNIKNTEPFYIVKANIDDGTPSGGVIDISENTVRAAGGVYELLMSTPTSNNKSTRLELLKISNDVYTDGDYQQIKNFAKLPSVKHSDFGGSSLQATSSGTFILFGSNPMGGKSLGDYRVLSTTTPSPVEAVTYHRPQTSEVTSDTILLSGTVLYGTTKSEFYTYITVTPNEVANTIDFTVQTTGAGEQTITWSGATGVITNIDIGLGASAAFRLELQRFSDYASFVFLFDTGQEPSYSDLKWTYSGI